jgi:formylglycine-generating enzyme required for sulfatase activity
MGQTEARGGAVRWRWCTLALAVLVVLAMLAPAGAATKRALVIGINAYPNLGAAAQLERAVADAEAVGDRLAALEFKVTRLTAPTQITLDAILRGFDAFKKTIEPGDMVVLFFAGHGMGLSDGTYLVPGDVREPSLEVEATARRAAINENELTDALRQSRAGIVIAVIDACRNDLFSRALGRELGNGRGLRPAETEGVFKLYSASEGQTALDRLPDGDTSKNSVFTRVFLKALATPGLNLSALGSTVRDDVHELARSVAPPHMQTPAVYDKLIGSTRVVLVPEPPAREPAPITATQAAVTQSISVAETQDRLPGSGASDSTVTKLPGVQTAVAVPPVTPVVPPSDPCSGAVTVSFSSRCHAPLTAAQERGLQPKDSFRECDKCPEIVVVPAGSFTMGSPQSEKERDKDEGPQHRVTFDRIFAVGKFAVTFEEWDACVADGGCNGYRPNDQGWGRGWQPAVNLSWDDAKSYVAWLSRKTGKTYRLLSEAEREYVARAGTTTPFWWGGSISTQQANYNGNLTYGGPKGEDRQRTLPVDSFQPNPWGLYQVHGNVWEWAEDCYHDSYQGAPTDGSAWTSGDCSRRVVRGGSWADDPVVLRAADRNRSTVGIRSNRDSFRVGRTLRP